MARGPEPFVETNRRYEAWMAERCAVIASDLAHKHQRMAGDPFIFLRATCFRWASTIETLCPHLADAEPVLSCGDLHAENFGTWRDAEGRLIWGINDFDEAASIPWPFDLVRLMTSVRLARGLVVAKRDAAAAILEGYRRGLDDPASTPLEEASAWLRRLSACTDKQRTAFWSEIKALPRRPLPPAACRAVLVASLPEPDLAPRFAHREAGEGSRGRPRFAAVASWRGGHVVREAKAVLPSAWEWAHGRPDASSRLLEAAALGGRAMDPFLRVDRGWVVRRLSPDQRKAELGSDPGGKLEVRLLRAMGREAGSLHAWAGGAKVIARELAGRHETWLHDAAKRAAAQVLEDRAAWSASRACHAKV